MCFMCVGIGLWAVVGGSLNSGNEQRKVYNGGCRDKNEIDCELLIEPLSVEMRREKRGEGGRPTAQRETHLLF